MINLVQPLIKQKMLALKSDIDYQSSIQIKKSLALYSSTNFKNKLLSLPFYRHIDTQEFNIENLQKAKSFSFLIIELPEESFEVYKLALMIHRIGLTKRTIAVSSGKSKSVISSMQHIASLIPNILSFDEIPVTQKGFER